jgi:hypothetical protein
MSVVRFDANIYIYIYIYIYVSASSVAIGNTDIKTKLFNMVWKFALAITLSANSLIYIVMSSSVRVERGFN